ncbi:unnamed protein product [Cuscuta epithymum]|uniref:Uncharacterized protein n=1 Tax=Cuscuta epithymum TaxID=186058 RepID=A0AAV0GK60_9ASTE|nr:unnamed protein product [Cuscuta epithymum]CAH9148301.1 unnamed protein product [Cuscuta epithymum]
MEGPRDSVIPRTTHQFNFAIFIFAIYFDQTVVIFDFYFSFCRTLLLGLRDEMSALIVFDSISHVQLSITESASHIAFMKVIDSKSCSRAGGWALFFCLFVRYLNVMISI